MNPPPGVPRDIFRAMRKVIAKERAVRRTRDQVRRVRVILSGVSWLVRFNTSSRGLPAGHTPGRRSSRRSSARPLPPRPRHGRFLHLTWDAVMTADTLLSRLDKVKTTGQGRWVACCPAHQDKRPSLHIKECDDGRVLVHCFTGCGVSDILAAVGLEFSDLFPEKLDLPDHHKPPERQPFPAKDVLKTLVFEATIVAVAAGTLRTQGFLHEADVQRLALAYERLSAALVVMGTV